MKVFTHLTDILTLYSTARKALRPLIFNNLTAVENNIERTEIPLTVKTLKQLSTVLDNDGMITLKDEKENITTIVRIPVH